MQIRRIREEEAPAVLALWNEAAGNSLSQAGANGIQEQLRQCASHPEVFCLVAEDGGELLGFLTASGIVPPTGQSPVGEIEELYVTPAARRRGIGRLLVNAARTALLERGARRIDAKVEYVEPQAMAFWRNTGWNNIFTTFTFYQSVTSEETISQRKQDQNMGSAHCDGSTQCLFCNIPPEKIVAENEYVFAIRDGFPVTELHTLVIPKRHVAEYFGLNPAEVLAGDALLRQLREQIMAADSTVESFNIGMNSGAVAGQTIFHCHTHLIPRRQGDVENPRGGVRHLIPGKGDY